jgi:transmembrane sensor
MSHEGSDKEIREQAARWVVRMTDPTVAIGPQEQERFQRWMLSNPRHERAYLDAITTATLASDLPASERARHTEWAAQNAGNEVRRRRNFLMWGLAASVLAVAGAGSLVAHRMGWFGEVYSTGTGETRVVTFNEGSVAYLNTRTELRWMGTDRDRRVVFYGGEALFDVVHDETRPFRVQLDDSEIHVLGTRFNVYRKQSGETVVTVLEGTVEVRGYGVGGSAQWTRTLHANQQIEYRSIGLLREPHATEAENAVRWRAGILKIEDEPLPNVLDELTRYTDQRILIRDPRLAEIRVGGALSTRNVRSALSHLERLAPIEVHETDGTFTLDYRAPRSGSPEN